MAATIFYLVRNPKALQKASDEVHTKFSNVEEITQGAQLSACTYLRACIDEAMRMSPSVGGIAPREVLPGGITIDGTHVPAGVVVGTPHYTIHHNGAYYPEPFAYVPERWIVGAQSSSLSSSSSPFYVKTSGGAVSTISEGDVALAQSAFCPFSIGPRGCIGKGLAYIELTTTLARLLFLYDMRRVAGPDPSEGRPDREWGRQRPGEYQLIDQFTSLKDGPMVEFRRRS
jgi:cytochrome P450